MLIPIKKTCLNLAVIAGLVYVFPVYAQEADSDTELPQLSTNLNNRLLYLDIVRVLEEGIDSVAPEPFYQEQPNPEDDPEYSRREEGIR